MVNITVDKKKTSKKLAKKTSKKKVKKTNEEIANLLSKDVVEFNKYREENPDQDIHIEDRKYYECNLKSANLKNMTLKKINFVECDMALTKFRGSRIIGCRFAECNMVSVNFRDNSIVNTIFKECNMSDCQGKNVNLIDVLFRANCMLYASFTKSIGIYKEYGNKTEIIKSGNADDGWILEGETKWPKKRRHNDTKWNKSINKCKDFGDKNGDIIKFFLCGVVFPVIGFAIIGLMACNMPMQ
jgi:hypothetical protein